MPAKAIFGLKQKRNTITIKFIIFKLVKVPNFTTQFTDSFDSLGHIFSKSVFLVENRKSEYHHQSQRFQISLSKKFDLK